MANRVVNIQLNLCQGLKYLKSFVCHVINQMIKERGKPSERIDQTTVKVLSYCNQAKLVKRRQRKKIFT